MDLLLAAKRADPEGNTIGVDMPEGMIERARQPAARGRTFWRKPGQLCGIVAQELSGVGRSTVKVEFAVGSRCPPFIDGGNLRPQYGPVRFDRTGN